MHTILPMSLSILLALLGAVWATRHIVLSIDRGADALDPDAPGPPTDAPHVHVVVAARDEQETIEACVRSMADQDYPSLDITVVDDRSSDRTGEIVRGLIDEGLPVRLIRVDRLPEGWCGKNHAMQRGIETCPGDWICMIDADCTQTSGRTVSAAVHRAVEVGADLLSILPEMDLRTFWEHALQPVCSGILMVWHDPVKVNNPDRPNAYANGAFMLMRREAWVRIGGHEAVASSVNEDLEIARRVKGSGLTLRVVTGRGLYAVRMYDSLGAIVRGWTRIFHGSFPRVGRVLRALRLLCVMSLLPWLALVGGAVAWGLGAGGTWGLLAAVSAGTVAIQLSVIYRFTRLLGGRGRYAWTYPIGAVLALWILLKTLAAKRRGATLRWRGTTYAVGR